MAIFGMPSMQIDSDLTANCRLSGDWNSAFDFHTMYLDAVRMISKDRRHYSISS